MKRTALYFYISITSSAILLISCKKEPQENFGKPTNKVSDLGKEIFEGKGTCIACHKPDAKIIGPSLQDIGKIYKEKKISIVDFLKGNQDPVVDPQQFEVMKTNLALTKTFSDEELKALENYIFSFSK
jgi:cytochrome c